MPQETLPHLKYRQVIESARNLLGCCKTADDGLVCYFANYLRDTFIPSIKKEMGESSEKLDRQISLLEQEISIYIGPPEI